MIRNALLALAGLSLAVPAVPQDAFPSPFELSFATVPRLDCGEARGSGVRLSDTLVITAAHVMFDEKDNSTRQCKAFGQPMTNVVRLPGLDVATGQAAMEDGFRAIVSCDGIQEGRVYMAMGYPDGDAPDVQMLIGTNRKAAPHQAILKGRVYHGMSGGAVIEQSTGRVVAIINALNPDYPLTFVTPLSETYLCKS